MTNNRFFLPQKQQKAKDPYVQETVFQVAHVCVSKDNILDMTYTLQIQ